MQSIHEMLFVTVERLYRRKALKSIEKIFEKSRTVDIAGVLSSFELEIAEDLFKLVKTSAHKADVLSHMKPDKQKEFIKILSEKQIIELVQLMDSDDAADLLSLLADEESESILKKMVPKDSQDVAELMIYPSDSAGGLMTTDVLSLNQNLIVSDAISKIQSQRDEVLFYIYIVNSNNNLVGVLSLKQLLLCSPDKQLKEIMLGDVISVHVTDKQSKVVEIVERYDFLALPVVNIHNQLEGVITVDDVIDVIREEAQEQFLSLGQSSRKQGFAKNLWMRVSWLSYSFFAGLVCFITLFMLPNFISYGEFPLLEKELAQMWSLFCFFPMALILGLTVSNQSYVTTTSHLQDVEMNQTKWMNLFSIEFLTTMSVIVFFSSLLSLIIFYLGLSVKFFVLYLSLQIFSSMCLGTLLPFLFYKARKKSDTNLSPLLIICVAVLTVGLFYGLLNLW